MFNSVNYSIFDQIALTKAEIKILKALQKQEVPISSLNYDAIQRLYRLDMISTHMSATVRDLTIAYVTPQGRDYYAYMRNEKRKMRLAGRRYWITTAIAILALVLAGISLAAQLHLIQLPGA